MSTTTTVLAPAAPNPPKSDPALLAEFIRINGRGAVKKGYYRILACIQCGGPYQLNMNPRRRAATWRKTCGLACSANRARKKAPVARPTTQTCIICGGRFRAWTTPERGGVWRVTCSGACARAYSMNRKRRSLTRYKEATQHHKEMEEYHRCVERLKSESLATLAEYAEMQ